MTQRHLFQHAETTAAILVSTTPLYHEAERRGAWLPLSQISVVERRMAFNPSFGQRPETALILGTVVTVDAPDWLLDDRGLTADADVLEGAFARPLCPHGDPLTKPCRDCVREHQEATA